MAQSLTLVSIFAAAIGVWWWLRRRRTAPDDVHVAIRLDGAVPGAHLIWDVDNGCPTPVTLSAFVIHPRASGNDSGEAIATVPISSDETLEPGAHTRLAMDVDWRLFDARTIATRDADGREHLAPADQLEEVQDQLHALVDRPRSSVSASDWLRGAANLAFGVVLLGLGFFMLMWVLATG